jgi:hypothetical protein
LQGGKRKGKSAEEKKQLMLNVFTEKEEVFNLKVRRNEK